MKRTGLLYLVSGPSGSGKTTLCRRLADDGEARYATSCTTRAPRTNEVNGTDYFFLSEEEFQANIQAGAFLEYACVHGHYYGTLEREVLGHLEQGQDLVLDIDVQGAQSIRSHPNPLIQNALIDLFIKLDEDELKKRLTGRGSNASEDIKLRLNNAREELSHWDAYQYCLHSKTHEEDYLSFKSLLIGARLKTQLIAPHS